jgi:amino acid permease
VSSSNKHPRLIVPAVVLGIVFVVLAVVYFVEPAGSLPSFFPGHESGSSHHHFKHGIASVVVAACFFLFAWFQTGPNRTQADRGDSA